MSYDWITSVCNFSHSVINKIYGASLDYWYVLSLNWSHITQTAVAAICTRPFRTF